MRPCVSCELRVVSVQFERSIMVPLHPQRLTQELYYYHLTAVLESAVSTPTRQELELWFPQSLPPSLTPFSLLKLLSCRSMKHSHHFFYVLFQHLIHKSPAIMFNLNVK